jgi:hypothetical protein
MPDSALNNKFQQSRGAVMKTQAYSYSDTIAGYVTQVDRAARSFISGPAMAASSAPTSRRTPTPALPRTSRTRTRIAPRAWLKCCNPASRFCLLRLLSASWESCAPRSNRWSSRAKAPASTVTRKPTGGSSRSARSPTATCAGSSTTPASRSTTATIAPSCIWPAARKATTCRRPTPFRGWFTAWPRPTC